MKLHLLKMSIALLICGTMFQADTSAAVVQVGSAVFQPADGSFDISVMLNNDASSDLNLASFSLQLAITPTGPRRVEFNSTTQPDTLTNTSYIFFGNSAAATDSTTPWSVGSSSGGTNNDFTFADLTNDTFNVTLAGNTSKLLAQIHMTPGLGSFAPQAGDQFTISVVSAGTSFFTETFESVPFNSTSGTLSVPVPEPSTSVMVVIGTGVLIACRRSRKGANPKVAMND